MVLTVAEVAALLRVSRATVCAWARAGKYGARRVGGRWRFNIYHLPLDPLHRDDYRRARQKAGMP